MYNTIINCVTMSEGKGWIELVAEFVNGSIEKIGTFIETELKVDSIIPYLIGCTYSQARQVIESRD